MPGSTRTPLPIARRAPAPLQPERPASATDAPSRTIPFAVLHAKQQQRFRQRAAASAAFQALPASRQSAISAAIERELRQRGLLVP